VEQNRTEPRAKAKIMFWPHKKMRNDIFGKNMVSKINPTFVVISTIVNVCLVAWFVGTPAQVESQPDIGVAQVYAVDRQEQCNLLNAGEGACPKDYFNSQEIIGDETEVGLEEDPMLMQMPGLDFKAYRRADISSFYREPPGSRTEREPAFQGQAGKFVNMSPERLDLHW
jgi:hypothetical protein